MSFNKKKMQFNLALSVICISSCIAFVSCIGKKNGSRVQLWIILVLQLTPLGAYVEQVLLGHRILCEQRELQGQSQA